MFKNMLKTDGRNDVLAYTKFVYGHSSQLVLARLRPIDRHGGLLFCDVFGEKA